MTWPHQKGTEPETGSRIGPTVRVGNRQLRGIPAGQRALEVVCPEGGSRSVDRATFNEDPWLGVFSAAAAGVAAFLSLILNALRE
jgi:hypothetical protein